MNTRLFDIRLLSTRLSRRLPPTRVVATTTFLVIALGAAVMAAAQDGGLEFVFDPEDDQTEVQFTSKATLETFHGKTRRLSGWVRLDETDVRGLSAELRLDLASLNTGIGLRDQHMRNNVLHTEDHPEAVLEVSGARVVGSAALPAGAGITATLPGTLTLHGVIAEVEIPVQATRSANGSELSIEATFTVALADHEIERPKMLMLKVAEEVQLSVKATARLQPPAGP